MDTAPIDLDQLRRMMADRSSRPALDAAEHYDGRARWHLPENVETARLLRRARRAEINDPDPD